MTEHELLDIFTTTQALMHDWATTYFSIVTAYLVAAYAIGARLTRSQVFIASASFFIFSAMCAWGAIGTGLRMLELKSEILMLNPTRGFLFCVPALAITSGLLAAGIFIGLKFMWDVRHARTGQ
jgi:hypothetical protein